MVMTLYTPTDYRTRTSDTEICRYADLHDYIVVTKDADFRGTHIIQGTPRKLIRILLGNTRNDDLQNVFSEYIQVVESRFALSDGYFEVHRDWVSFYGKEKKPSL